MGSSSSPCEAYFITPTLFLVRSTIEAHLLLWSTYRDHKSYDRGMWKYFLSLCNSMSLQSIIEKSIIFIGISDLWEMKYVM